MVAVRTPECRPNWRGALWRIDRRKSGKKIVKKSCNYLTSLERENIALSTTDKLIMDNRYIGDPDTFFNENNPFLEMLRDV